MAFRYAKFGFFVLMAVAFYFIALIFPQYVFPNVGDLVFVKILILLVLNYAFFKMILYYISYYNDLIIFSGFEVIIIRSTLIRANYIEIIDINRITKIDTYVNGIVQNIIGYGTLIIEQQREEVREFKLVPEPHRAVKMLNKTKQLLLTNQLYVGNGMIGRK